MQDKSKSPITIIGGTYRELCLAYIDWNHIYGSGLRALSLYQVLNYFSDITYYSACDKVANQIEYYYRGNNTKFKLLKSYDVKFQYEHPFRVSNIFPRPDVLYAKKKIIKAKNKNVLVFGMIDADFEIEGDNVVYDPQTCVLPHLFTDSSKANRLVYVLNMHEAIVLSGGNKNKDILDFFFDHEKCFALIIKNGPFGAYLYDDKKSEPKIIPLFKTPKVFSIGSGDIFTGYFSHEWFRGKSLYESALAASKAVACYSAKKGNIKDIPNDMLNFRYSSLNIKGKGKVYLAGPFFNFSQRWLVDEFYHALKGEFMDVFSPLHNVGIGNAEEVTSDDIKGLNDSKVVLALMDGLDSGTLFEVGYAVAKNKKIVAYVENESEESLQMFKGTYCDIENDFTTAIYKTCWYAYEE